MLPLEVQNFGRFSIVLSSELVECFEFCGSARSPVVVAAIYFFGDGFFQVDVFILHTRNLCMMRGMASSFRAGGREAERKERLNYGAHGDTGEE